MDQIRANTPAPLKAKLVTELLSVQMSWGNGCCTRAASPGDQQTRDFGPWDARRSRAMMRANAWGHELMGFLMANGTPFDVKIVVRLNICQIKSYKYMVIPNLNIGQTLDLYLYAGFPTRGKKPLFSGLRT